MRRGQEAEEGHGRGLVAEVGRGLGVGLEMGEGRQSGMEARRLLLGFLVGGEAVVDQGSPLCSRMHGRALEA